jgi:anti-sigma-K factor RskA
MDKEQLLSSDLLERYALGAVSNAEIRLVEQFIKSDPEIAKEVEAFEISLEKVAIENEIGPSPNLKYAVLKRIEGRKTRRPRRIIASFISISLRSRLLGYVASFMGGVLLSVLLSWSHIRQQKSQLEDSNSKIAQLEENYDQLNAFYVIVNSPGTVPVLLTGSSGDQPYEAMALINAESKTCSVHLRNLPRLDNSRTYQVWADVSGAMVNLGILDYEAARRGYAKLLFIPNVKSLNITIEPSGGSLRPTVSNLVASGSI